MFDPAQSNGIGIAIFDLNNDKIVNFIKNISFMDIATNNENFNIILREKYNS